MSELPAFLDRATWSAEQHARNDARWATISEKRAEQAMTDARTAKAKRERERIERRLEQIGDAEPGSVNARVAGGLRAKLARLNDE